MATVRHLLENKGVDVWSTSPGESVYNALKLMADKNIGAILVLDGGRLVGIFSERDYARKVILRGKSSMDTPVREIMTGEVITVSPQTTVEGAMELMTEKRFRHLPVVEDGRVIGVVSIGDLVKYIIDHQQFVIGQLENYISGTPS